MSDRNPARKCRRPGCDGALFAVWETNGRLIALCEDHATEIAARLDTQDAATRGAHA